MRADRLSAFTDGVIAIVMTIIVLELPVPARPRRWRRCARIWPLLAPMR